MGAAEGVAGGEETGEPVGRGVGAVGGEKRGITQGRSVGAAVGAAGGETVGGSTVEGGRPGEAMGQGHPRPAIFE